MIKMISSAEVRKRLGELIDRVGYSGEEYLITKHGKPANVKLVQDKTRGVKKSSRGGTDPTLEQDLREFETQYAQALSELAGR